MGREGPNAAVVNAGPVLAFLSSDADLIIARKSRKGFEQVARYSVADSATWSHPVLLGRQVLIKDESSLALWSFD
jgi:hypothetical protein